MHVHAVFALHVCLYHRETRKLARKQFLCKSHIRKIQVGSSSHRQHLITPCNDDDDDDDDDDDVYRVKLDLIFVE
jgi:hypothetical protein